MHTIKYSLCFFTATLMISSATKFVEISFVIDFIKAKPSPEIILENLCWSKAQKITFQKQVMENRFRYLGISNNRNSLIFEELKYNYTFTVVTEIGCNFKEFLQHAHNTVLIRYPNVWIIFGEFGQIKKLNLHIPVNSLFVIPKVHNSENTRLSFNTVYNTNKNFTEYIESSLGEWSDQHEMYIKDIILTRNRTNFFGMNLRVSYVITDNDTFQHLTDYRNKHLDNLTKINFILFNVICDLLNTTQVKIFRDDWGFKSKKATQVFTQGMFGDLTYDRADIGGTVSFTPASRLKYFKYLFAPMKEFNVNFVFRAPSLAYYSNLFVLPFDKLVWFTIGGLLVFCSIIIKIIFNWETKENTFVLDFQENKENTPNFLDIIMMQIAIMCQMDFYYEPRGLSGKIATFMVLLAFTFIYTSFSARIVLLLQSNTNSIKNLQSLYEAKLDFGVEDQPFNRYYFTGPSDRANEYWRSIIYENKIKSATSNDKFLSAEDGMQLVRDSYFAFHVEQNVASYLITKTFSTTQRCSLRVVETIYKSDIPYLSCPKHSPYIEFFLVSFRRIAETGVHNREFRKCFTKYPSCEGRANNFVSVGLIECYFAFLVFGAGIGLSLIILVVELLSSSYLHLHCAL